MAFVAKKIFLTKGVGKHRERLSSFELALRNAGIAAGSWVHLDISAIGGSPTRFTAAVTLTEP